MSGVLSLLNVFEGVYINRSASLSKIALASRRLNTIPLPKTGPLLIINPLHKVDGARVRLPFEAERIYQYFLKQVENSVDALEQIEEVISGRYAYVSLGGPNGADLTGPDIFHSPPGWDRAYAVDLEAFTAFCAKGTGFARSAQDAYQNEIYRFEERRTHIPFDINPHSMFFDHVVVGGNDCEDLLKNAEGANKILKLAFHAGRQERGGMIVPLSIVLIKSFPVPRRNHCGDIIRDLQGNIRWENMAGWDYFTNPQVFSDKAKLQKVARHVRRRTSSRLLKWICSRYEQRIEKGLKVSRFLREQVGRAFMRYFAPAAYHYLGDSFRIGNAYRQLVSNGFHYIESGMVEQGIISRQEMLTVKNRAKQLGVPALNLIDPQRIKEYMDKVIVNIYRPAGLIKLTAEDEIAYDLRTGKGRAVYLQAIGKMNPEQSTYLVGKIMEEISAQLGILHGIGGNAGGFSDMPVGKISLVLQDRTTGKLVFVDLRLEADQCITEIFNDENKEEMIKGEIDLSNCWIVSMKAKKNGEYKCGAPGGGATRADNLGYGLRDLHSIFDEPKTVESFIKRYPSNLHGLEIGNAIYHLHCKIVQESDLNFIFAEKVIDKVDGEERSVPTALGQLNAIFGGGKAELNLLESAFWATYQKWYERSMRKNASPGYQEIEGKHPIYIIQGSFREKECRQALNAFLTACSQVEISIPDLLQEEEIMQALKQQILKGRTPNILDVIIGKLIITDKNRVSPDHSPRPNA
jgi:hypothetical protein